MLTRDALPFVKTVGHRNHAKIYGINSLGLRRKKFTAKRIKALKEAYRWLFQKGLRLQEAIEAIRSEELETQDVSVLIQLVERSKRGFVRDVSSDE